MVQIGLIMYIIRIEIADNGGVRQSHSKPCEDMAEGESRMGQRERRIYCQFGCEELARDSKWRCRRLMWHA